MGRIILVIVVVAVFGISDNGYGNDNGYVRGGGCIVL